MNIRYYFYVSVIILAFSSVVKASDRTSFPREASVIVTSAVLETNVFLEDQVDSLLNKIIITTHPANHDVFWKSVAPLFHKIKRLYTSLGAYLYASIFSIFNG
ncbi:MULTISPECIES: hypothetical protein [unclassified Bartonella]|uniref:hypothetical protein n=1 Tax=unclassified Bartonella TaxID=2645622 RepID=UPI0023610488|nr:MULTISPECIES: hypothetical protein [unclassified Bartonella]